MSADIAKRYGLKPGDDLSQIPKELRRMVAYRIPHQGKSSTVIGKIVGILPASYSKAIMLPANLTEMTGSDFDIDKLFVMSPSLRVTESRDSLRLPLIQAWSSSNSLMQRQK